jgi:hypothetical protein
MLKKIRGALSTLAPYLTQDKIHKITPGQLSSYRLPSDPTTNFVSS